MSPNVVERTAITWTSFDERFSIAPRTVPVSGRPAEIPEPQTKQKSYEDRHEALTKRKVYTATKKRVSPTLYTRSTGTPIRNPNSNKGRTSAIPLATCPITGVIHDWRPGGKRQDVCHDCGRSRMANSVSPMLPRTGRWDKCPPVVLMHPERWGHCPKGERHEPGRGGWKDGVPGAVCRLCKKQGRRLPDAGEVRR